MKRIKIRTGVVLLSVCDEHMLVATREARAAVPYVQQINSAAAYYWKLLESNTEMNAMVDQAAEHFNMPKIKALITVSGFVQKLAETGYVTVEEVENAE